MVNELFEQQISGFCICLDLFTGVFVGARKCHIMWGKSGGFPRLDNKRSSLNSLLNKGC